MEKKQPQELKIELTPDVATGHYANLAILSHSPQEFYLDFVMMATNMPQAKGNRPLIMHTSNAKSLLCDQRDHREE
ncbi:MAG: DUF3467 domain-containing protein [Muribaculaceae bacterium]|nr:DUF3467 domain-containing protein [Muribaculaceae bacterium]